MTDPVEQLKALVEAGDKAEWKFDLEVEQNPAVARSITYAQDSDGTKTPLNPLTTAWVRQVFAARPAIKAAIEGLQLLEAHKLTLKDFADKYKEECKITETQAKQIEVMRLALFEFKELSPCEYTPQEAVSAVMRKAKEALSRAEEIGCEDNGGKE